MGQKHQLTTSDYLKYDEYKRFCKCLHDDQNYRWEMYATLSFCSSLRVSDVLKIKWCEILGKPMITVTEQKTGKTREIPFNASVQAKFNELYNLLGRPDMKDYVMQCHTHDKPVTQQYINRYLKELKEKYHLKINHFSTHTFRKTFGRYVYESNNRSPESLILLNKIFHHTNLQTTKIYIGITKEEVNGIFESIKL